MRSIRSILLRTLEVDEALEIPALESVLFALEKMDGAGVSEPEVDSMRKNPALSEATSSRTNRGTYHRPVHRVQRGHLPIAQVW